VKPLKPIDRQLACLRIEDPETLQVISAEMSREQSRNATEEARRLIRDGVRFRRGSTPAPVAASA
jgi:hypothetical protein